MRPIKLFKPTWLPSNHEYLGISLLQWGFFGTVAIVTGLTIGKAPPLPFSTNEFDRQNLITNAPPNIYSSLACRLPIPIFSLLPFFPHTFPTSLPSHHLTKRFVQTNLDNRCEMASQSIDEAWTRFRISVSCSIPVPFLFLAYTNIYLQLSYPIYVKSYHTSHPPIHPTYCLHLLAQPY